MSRSQADQWARIIAAIGLVAAAVGWLIAPRYFPHAWLAALVSWIGWPLGCMGLLLIHALTGGRWGTALRPQFVAGMRTLWLLVPVLVPLVVVLPALYSWLRPGEAELLPNRFYLNGTFLALRVLIYLAVWLGLAWLIHRAILRPDADVSLMRLAPAGLIALALTVTFAAIDSTMSLDPRFASSVYGLIELAGMGLFALSVSVLAAALAQALSDDDLETLGRLLMGLVILWAYLDFVQFLIVWQSNLPSEAQWYFPRIGGGWGVVAITVALLHFALPFFVLLSPRLRHSARGIAVVAALLVFGTVIRSLWLVIPASGRGLNLIDVLAMLGVLGAALAIALREPTNPNPSRENLVRRHA
jgi:hypothetical protein